MGASAMGVLRFRVLGAMEAVGDDGEPLRLGGQRQRALLALLLLRAGEPVSVEQVVEELFGADRSKDAVGAVRVAVSRLRRLLENGGSSCSLATRAGGYVLEARAEEVDAALFERLAREGREALRAGEAATASQRLREALALWRGPPYADVAHLEFVQAEIRRLDELRVAALMDRIDADLGLGHSSELIGELEALVAENPLQERLRGQLMLGLYRSGRQADALAVYRQTGDLLRDELGLEPSPALQELEGAILRQEPGLGPAAAPSPAASPVVCPFKGLASFDRYDAEYFCGRERLVSDLVATLAGTTLVGIVGPSGIGKSSLLRAGVLPALASGALPGSESWRQVLIRPGEHPSAQVERALGGERLVAAMASLARGERLVLAVDQLEEAFTVCPLDHEREAFLALLADAAADTQRRAIVLVALRADFYGRCASYPGFARALSRSHVLVGPMTRTELAEAIELPATRAGLEVDRSLVDSLVADVEGEPGGLPLLSTTLLELWRERDGHRLRHERYRAIGGVRGAVARLAEEAYTELDPDGQRLARSVMLRLAAGENGSLVRRRVPLTEIQRIGGAGRVLAVLTDARLLTVSEGEVEISHEALMREWPRYQGWLEEDRIGRRLHAHLGASAREWELHARDAGELYRGARLAAASDWAGQHDAELDPLEREFIAASRAAAEREARRQRLQNRRLRMLLAGVGVLLALSVTAGIIALVKQNTATNEARAALAGKLGAEAVNEPRIDLAMLLAREAVNLDRTADTESTLLATLLRSPAAIGTFTVPLDARPQAVTVSPDGRTLAVPDNIGRQLIYDTRTHALLRALPNAFVEPAWYSPDGSLLIYATPSGLAVDDAHTFARRTLLKPDPLVFQEPVLDSGENALAVSPDRRTVYLTFWATDALGNARTDYLDRWSLPTGRRLPRIVLGTGETMLRLLEHGSRLGILKDNNVTVFDTRTMRPAGSTSFQVPGRLGQWRGSISPNGSTATLGSEAGSVYFVDLARGTVHQAAGGHSNVVTTVVYSPSGKVVVTSGNDNQVKVWNPATAGATEVLSGHGGDVHGIGISGDGRTLFTASLDGAIFEWDLGTGRRFGRPFTVGAPPPCCDPDVPGTPPLSIAPGGARFATRVGTSIALFSSGTLIEQTRFSIGARGGIPTAVAWSPRGDDLAVAGQNGVVQLWDVLGAPRLIRSLAGLRSQSGVPESVETVAFSPDGTFVAAGDVNHGSASGTPDGHVAVWRMSTGRLVSARDVHVTVDSLAFSAGGHRLAVGLDDGRVVTFGGDGRPLRTLRPLGSAHLLGVTSLAFAPDGTLATGNYAGLVQLWDPLSGRSLSRAVLVAAAPVASLAFDRSGQRFATAGGSDGTVKLWSTGTLQQIGTSLSSATGSWSNAAFTPDGQKLIAVHDDGTAELWPVTVTAWERQACAVAGRNLTREEWSRFVTGYGYARVCP